MKPEEAKHEKQKDMFKMELLRIVDKSHPLGRLSEAINRDLPVGANLGSEMLWLADEAIQRSPFSVTEKTTLPPSGDFHDYWHPAPYYWPNPNTPNGIPYLWRDGERVPGTELYEEGSEKYDRTRLQRLFDDSTALALAWRMSGKREYAEHAAKHLVVWFVRPETRMNPHLKYAQVRMISKKGRRSNTGLIETKDFYYYLEAIRILREDGFIADSDWDAFCKWLFEFRHWLTHSFQGFCECHMPNNHGVIYDLQVAAISAFLDDQKALKKVFRRARRRLFWHFKSDGRQPREMSRTLTAHYCTFNLQAWVNMAWLAEGCGFDFWSAEALGGGGIRKGLMWLLPHYIKREWPYRQIKPFDWNRMIPLLCEAKYRYADDFGWISIREEVMKAPECFYPHDGIPPFWRLRFPSEFWEKYI